MENASKALLIAGVVLISVMVLSLGVYLFTTFGSTSKQITEQVESAQISEFNSQFTKYEGQTTIRAHDIVSIANLARQNNEKYDYYNQNGSSKPYYITVKVKVNNTNNFENYNIKQLQDFIKEYSLQSDNKTPYYFKCTSVNINTDTKYVNEIKFELIT